MKHELPHNLVLSTNGVIYCADGQRIEDYLLKSRLAKERELPLEIVVVDRNDFLEICRMASLGKWLEMELIQAA